MKSKTSQKAFAVAALSFAITDGGNAIQLLPAGSFRAKDGRPENAPHWFIDAAVAEKVIARAALRTNPSVIDYEHQTLHAGQSGTAAPAAGWFRGANLEWRDGEGLFATGVEWTPRAQTYIDNGEYRYISAVFPYHPKTGEVLDIYMAAITNNPALDGMQELESLAAACFDPSINQGDTDMNPVLAALLKALGLPEDTNEADALAALTALQTQAGKLDDTETALAALKAQLDKAPPTGEPDPAKFVPVGVVDDLRTELAALTAKINGGEVDKLVTDGLESGKLHKAQEEWARDLGNKDIAALTSYLETAQPIAALSGMQSTKAGAQDGEKEGELTEAELAICTATGIDPVEYAKNK